MNIGDKVYWFDGGDERSANIIAKLSLSLEHGTRDVISDGSYIWDVMNNHRIDSVCSFLHTFPEYNGQEMFILSGNFLRDSRICRPTKEEAFHVFVANMAKDAGISYEPPNS